MVLTIASVLPHAHDLPSTPLETLSLTGSTEPPEYNITYVPIFDDLSLPDQVEMLQNMKNMK